ncbi:hypothetical protein KY290_001143 [Solanum tuberosum]|uniref:Uncharacterized protein n=1 Tax=Solanum tuberosum TaxID=4113 RepID=A0ABQ7WNK4_SOLTU|nr:hypothetical protein KY290_001143 [Solanum tuberosum]
MKSKREELGLVVGKDGQATFGAAEMGEATAVATSNGCLKRWERAAKVCCSVTLGKGQKLRVSG